MMEAQYLGLHAIGWHDMLGTWPGKVLAIFILTTVIIGGLYIAFVTGRAAFAYWQRRRNSSGAPASIARYLHSLKETAQRLPSREKDRKSLKSFGVYLGTIADPPTPAQGRLLSQWDVIVVDPLQQGVVNAVDSHCSSTHILGRLDVSSCLGSTASTTNKQRIESLGIVTQSLASSFKNHDMQQTPFQGVLLSNWEEFFGPAVLNHLLGYINHIGLDVWLEISGLANETQYGDIDMGCIQGIVFQNATISPDGLDQDYYQMSKTRSIMRALARRKPAGSCTFAMWEVVDDEVTIPHHVMRRTLKWCNYNTAMSWIGPRSALVDADIAASRTVMKEPLSALAWLGDDAVARAHDHWRFNDKILQESSGNDPLYGTLDSFVPGLVGKLKIMCPTNGVITKSSETCINEPNLSIQNGHAHLDPFSVSPDGVDYTGLGCFQLGLDCSATDINELLEAQGRLRESDLLERLQQEELDEIARELRQIEPVDSEASAMYSSIQDLVHLLSKSTSATHNVRVWVGLHSGFRTCSETQVSGIYEADSVTGTTHIYLSSQTTDRTGAILHTFLSSRGFTRFECFTAEISLSAAKKSLCSKWGLPARLVRDVEGLTPVELLLWTQRLSQSTCDRSSALAAKVRAVCENQLLNAPSLAQLRRTSSVGYLGGKVTAEQLVQGRLQWYQTQGGSSLGYESAVALFKEIGVLIEDALINQDSNTLGKLAAVMDAVLKPSCIDVQADFLAMSVFCTVRKLALGEVYLEVLDRNPGPHLHHIQAACFAEFYAVGARCDAYFDTTPNELGRILFSQIRTYHYQHQPPLQDEGTTELPTTYASMDIDLDPDAAEGDTPLHYRITFLGIFAIPALVDIMLLTTVGRGLYLSAFMEDTDKTAATAALMVALLLGGAFGTWISSGGSYYFYSMAFPATSMFVMTRFVAGLAVVIIVGIVTLIGIGIAESFRYGIIFLVYLILLTTYLMVLSTLSIYQMPGHKFQSGRVVIVTCVPMLLVSPLLTTWLHHDIVIYPCLLAFFLAVLLFATRRVISKWNIWYFDIPCVTEQEIVGWYQRTYLPNVSDEKMPSYFTIRQTLWDCVRKERARHFWSKPTSDAFIQRLAMGYPATKFLLTWYCQSTRTRLPLPYSPTWNLQLKSGTETLVSMQKGLKLHSAFLHWVHSGQEVWGGLLFFALALMDKWTALLTGESIVGLSVSSETFRLAVGFGLAYYLMGAVVLDAVSQPLWAIAHKHTPEQVSSLESLNSAVLNNKLKRRSLYWSKLLKYSLLHIWGLAVTAALMWAFESSRSATQMYLAYVGAYSGLLWYQYSRIYVRHRADGAVALGTVVGFTTCLLLRLVPDRFAYGGVIGLAAGTWTTALISLLKANVGRTRGVNSNGTAAEVAVYTCSTLEPDPEIPQGTLASAFDGIMSMPLNLRYRIDPAQYPGVEVMEVLLLSSRRQSEQARRYSRAFPQAADLLRRTAELWKSGRILVELISAGSVLRSEELGSFRCLSKRTADLLHVIVITPLDQVRDTLQGRCFAIAEALVSSTAENCLGLSHDHAVLAELLVHGNYSSVSIPEGIKRQLQLQLQLSCRPQRELIASTQRAILRHLLLGIDIDQEWDLLPADVRMSLLQRACGKSYNVSTSQVEWIRSRFKLTDSADLDVWLEIYDMSASLAVAVNNYAQLIIDEETARTSTLNLSKGSPVLSLQSSDDQTPGCSSHGVKARLLQTYLKIKSCIKFTVLSLVADPEYQRELDYMLRTQPLFISWPAKRCLTCIWSFGKVLQDLILPLVLLHGRRRISSLYKSVRGQTVTVERHRVALDMLDGAFTCFMHSDQDGSSRLYQYSGRHEEEPDQTENLVSINTYTRDMVLRVREEFDHKGVSTNRFVYAYEPVVSSSSEARMRVPLQRQCLHGRSQSEILCYDGRGFVLSGSTVKGADPVRFQYWYAKNARSDSDLLRGEYIFPHITIQVAWSIPPPPPRSGQLDEWIPYPSVTRALFIQGDKIYSVEWAYDHRFHPTIQATLNGDPVPVPPMISEDWFNVLQKPTRSSFFHDNPLASFPAKVGTLSRLFRRNIRRYPLSISQGRTFLWKSWRASNDVDAVTARWLDELFLRSSQILKPYWRRRDRGNLEAATAYLDEHADAIVADVDLSQQVSSWAPLAFNFSDLASFGQGGDSRINTRTLSTQLNDSSSELHVLAMDTGTWPNEPGGVSACRRDLVNNLKQVRWHIIAESANDFGIPRFQVEHNVHSLTILPQWGLDFLHPTHGIFQNCLHSAIVERAWDLTDSDIRTNFLPVLATLVRCARMGRLDRVHVKEATQALVDLNAYFESSRSWNDVWMSDTVKQAWRELWLSEDMEGATPVSQWLDAERPTVPQLDTALDMWHRYLFIFSIPVPEKIPAVFQVSHHWTGATYGVLCKIKRQCVLQLWDHAISFREIAAYLSSALCLDSIFVNHSLISLAHLSCVLIQYHADIVLPCAEYFNPGWEIELGTCEGALQHRRLFSRKIDAVVNGIANMDRYRLNKEAKAAEKPTVVMLSHVRYVKDVKTAILAADVIINNWGFHDYRLKIYGDMERSPAYSSECQQMIDSKGLREHVFLMGLGDPLVALEDAWLFMNSSISEGLPLAMGEAALTGVPVVCTDVGASFCVVTDRASGQRFSEVVAPNDPISLAGAQIRVLALLGQWAAFAEDDQGYTPPTLSLQPSPEEVQQISQRMHDKAEQRRKLGLLGRENIYKNFSSERYLREHEQMLWLGKYRSRRALVSGQSSSSSPEEKLEPSTVLVEQTSSEVS